MIKFFRYIRKSLLMEDKTSKYIKYAIGEIVLVVIGILIALQINNWNKSQNEKQIEKQYLKNIVRDLEEQIKSIEVQMENEQSYYEAASYLIEDYNEDYRLTLDSTFYKLASSLTSRKTFVITDPTYTDLISSGNINIIRNQAYKDKLLNYYQELERIEKIIQNNNSLLIDQHYIMAFLKNGYYYNNTLEEYDNSLSKFPGFVVTPNYNIEIQDISEQIIMKNENKLALMNAISFRHNLALGHFEKLQNVKSLTQSLMQELKKGKQ
jgi:competence protein ComGC